MKKLVLTMICLLLGSSLALAQAKAGSVAPTKSGNQAQGKARRSGKVRHNNYTGCDVTAPLVNPDGSTFQDYIAPFADNYVKINLKAGHSYSVEAFDPTNQNVYGDQELFLYLVLPGCAGGDSFTDVAPYNPDISLGVADRISWIQATDAVQFIDIFNFDDINAHVYQMRVVDTTVYNSRWSTVVGFSTHYGFLNVTQFDIPAVLTVTEFGGTQHVVTPTIPGGGEKFEVISAGSDGSPGLQLPANLYGFSTFAYVGPAGAIKADGYFQAVQNGVFSIASTTWSPMEVQH